MEDDYYCYDDDMYGDHVMKEEETWETPLESKYLTAKNLMRSSTAECTKLLKEVITEDPEHGKWTFKSLKMLARATRIVKAYDEMICYYDQIAHFSHNSITPAILQKAMMKFIDQSHLIPSEYLRRVIAITLEVTQADKRSYSKLWFSSLIQRGTLLLENAQYTEALCDFQAALDWCPEDKQMPAQLLDTQRYTIYALMLRAYTGNKMFDKATSAYFGNMRLGHVLPPLRTVASVMEYGGHMFMRHGDWNAAYKVFILAFRSYNESGDAHRAVALKFAAVANMLHGSPVDIFVANETKVCADSPEVKPVLELLRAFIADDLAASIQIVRAPQNRGVFQDDSLMSPYIERLLWSLRINVFVRYVSCFSYVSITDLSERLLLSEEETVKLCTFALLQRIVMGSLNDSTGMLHLFNTVAPPSEKLRSEAILAWANALE